MPLCPERHPITNAIDGTNRWWQSPSIKNGRRFHWVTITLDLKQVARRGGRSGRRAGGHRCSGPPVLSLQIFQVAYVIVKAANSPRPGQCLFLSPGQSGFDAGG